MSNANKNNPACFGKIDIVFPKTDDGLRHTPANCMECIHKTDCLKSAIQGSGGLKIKEEFINRAYDSGRIGFWERWSRRKMLKQHMKNTDGGIS